MRGQVAEHLKEFLAQVNLAAAQAKQDGIKPSPMLARQNLQKLSAFMTDVVDVHSVYDTSLSSAANCAENGIPVRVFIPAAIEKKALPVLIYFHGGGHMCGSVELYDPMCRKMANAAEAIVISVEYRLAPEFPYPAGIQDALAVVKHYQTLLTDVRFNEELYIGGDSAGGAICASIVMAMNTDQTIKVDKQVLIYPSLDYTGSTESYQDNGTGYLLENTRIKWYFDHYFANGEDRTSASPLFNVLPSHAPETLVITAGCDPLMDEGLLYVEKLSKAGIINEHKHFAGMIHAFMNIEDLVPQECQELYSVIGKFLR